MQLSYSVHTSHLVCLYAPVYNYKDVLLPVSCLIATISVDCREVMTIMSWGFTNIDLSIFETAAWTSYHVVSQSASPTTGSIINLNYPASVLICVFLFVSPIMEEVNIFLIFNL